MDYRVICFLLAIGIISETLDNYNMPKLSKRATFYGWIDGRADRRTVPNYRRSSLLKSEIFSRKETEYIKMTIISFYLTSLNKMLTD